MSWNVRTRTLACAVLAITITGCIIAVPPPPPNSAQQGQAVQTQALRPIPPHWVLGSVSNPGLGDETEFVGGVQPPHRYKKWYSDQGNPLVGFDWAPGQWNREDCIGKIVPLFDHNVLPAPSLIYNRVIAKPGYAVGGVTVKYNVFIDGIKLMYYRLDADGSLDPSDWYESPWAGPYQSGKMEAKIGGDGRKVIGFVDDKAGVLHNIGLIMER